MRVGAVAFGVLLGVVGTLVVWVRSTEQAQQGAAPSLQPSLIERQRDAIPEDAYFNLEDLLSQARSAASGPLDHEVLMNLAHIEEHFLRGYEDAYWRWASYTPLPSSCLGNEPVEERKNESEQMYKEFILVSDRALEQFFTPEVIEAVPWLDLLADASTWTCAQVNGFKHDITGGALHLAGPDPSSDVMGVISIGDVEAWRDFVVEIEFTIHRGRMELFFRLPPVWQPNVESRWLVQDGWFEPDRRYLFTFTILGSTITEDDHEGWLATDLISWSMVRKGAFGIAVPKDTEIEITKLRARILR